MSLKKVSGIHQTKVIDTIFHKGWSHGIDLGDLSTLVSILEEKSLDGLGFSRQISKLEVKKLLIEETNMAIEKGVFGVPSFIINDNLFWGNDQMEHIELLLSGRDPLDKRILSVYLNRPRAIDREIVKK
jgi:2-hydroxychromene-2-carboxylate isomerase